MLEGAQLNTSRNVEIKSVFSTTEVKTILYGVMMSMVFVCCRCASELVFQAAAGISGSGSGSVGGGEGST